MHRPLLALLALCFAASPALLANPAERESPGHDITTLRERGAQATVIVAGCLEFAKDDPDSATLHVESVLKDDGALAARKSLPLRMECVDRKKPANYVIFCKTIDDQLEPFYGVPAQNADLPKYIRASLDLDDTDQEAMLRFYFAGLDSPDPVIASDAFLVFNYAKYDDVKKVARDFPADRIAQWLQDPQTPWWQYGVFSLLLGHCGKPEHAAVIREVLDDLRVFNSPRVGSVMVSYMLLAPEQGWAYTRAILAKPATHVSREVPGATKPGKEPSEDVWRRHEALDTVKFLLQHWPDVVSREKLIEGVSLALARPVVVDLAIDLLRELQAVDQVEKVLALADDPNCDYPIARTAIVRFAAAFRTHPKTKAFIARQEPTWAPWITRESQDAANEN